jgi:hypothetical protein
MVHKHFQFSIFIMALMASLIFGCDSSASPDTSIVWSGNFENGGMEGWEEGDLPGDEFLLAKVYRHLDMMAEISSIPVRCPSKPGV